MSRPLPPILPVLLLAFGGLAAERSVAADEPKGEPDLPKATIDGTGPGWKALGEQDFVGVNGDPDTWTWRDGTLHCTGQPVGVIRTAKPYTNFELVTRWRHLEPGGNSGVFVWASEEALKDLEPGKFPRDGIEVQILDNAFAQKYEERTGKKGTFFTTHGDIFPVGTSKMIPFSPTSPNGERSDPLKSGAWTPVNGTTTTSAASTARSASGSTAPRSPAATDAAPPPATSASNRKVRRSNSKISGSGSFPDATRDGRGGLGEASGQYRMAQDGLRGGARETGLRVPRVVPNPWPRNTGPDTG